jgi:hypothetical protein
MKKVARDIQHYVPLFGILLATISGFIMFTYDKTFQMVVVVSSAIAYVIWGVVHHHIHKDLHLPVVIEYILIAALGIVIVFSLIFRA